MTRPPPPPQSLKINPYGHTLPKADPVVVELPDDALIDAGGTRPIHIPSIHNPGMAAPFTPPPPPMEARPEPMLPPPTPAPGFATLQSAAFQQQMPMSQSYPQVHSVAQPQPQPQQNPNAYPSYAPTAMDIAMQQAYATPPQPKKSRTGLVLGLVFGLGFVFLLGLGGAGFAYYKLRMEVDESVSAASVSQTTDSTPAVATTSTPAATTAATVAPKPTFDPPPLATNDAKVTTPAFTKPATTSNTTSSYKPTTTQPKTTTTTTTTTTAKVEPKVDAKKDDAKTDTAKTDAAKTDTTAKTEGGTGTIRSWSAEAGKTITVDGAIAGVAPAPLVVACGMHKIQVGSGPTKNVNVPCNGTVTVGSPDGQ